MKQDESMADAWLRLLKNGEFQVNKAGEVVIPPIHIHPATFEKFAAEIAAKGKDFEDKVEHIKEQKSQAALKREEDRLARYDSEVVP
jgi:hypothetical protein